MRCPGKSVWRRALKGAVKAGLVAAVLSISGASLLPDVMWGAGGSAKGGGQTSKSGAVKTPPPLATGPVSFVGEGGMNLSGLYFAGREQGPGVVLVHMDGRSAEDWRHFGERISRMGFHALALDLRGHGKSTRMGSGKELVYEQLDEQQYQNMIKDVGAAVQFLRTKTVVNPDGIGLVGASVGANLSLRWASEDARINNLVLLSPGLDYKGLAAEDALQKYGERPLFIAVSREDNFAAKSSLVLDSMARGKKFLQIYTGAGHGTRMLIREPGLETAMIGWLNGTFSLGDEAELIPPESTKPSTRPRTP